MILEEKKKAIKKLIEQKQLVTPQTLQDLEQAKTFEEYFQTTKSPTITVELEKDNNIQKVKILQNHKIQPQERKIQDTTQYFKKRYKQLKEILLQRQEMLRYKTCSINKLNTEANKISIIVMIDEKRETKNQNILLNCEDLTGTITCIVNKNNKETFEEAEEIVQDEVVGLIGHSDKELFFVDKIIFPEIPNSTTPKTAETESYVAFMSDIHIGSKQFMKEEFERFIKWTRGETGTQKQKEIANKLKYIVVAGDIADGIGIYLDQKNQLAIKNLQKQYETFLNYLKQIPTHIQIILSPGNHDGVQIFEPQEALGENFSSSLASLPNIINISNPGLINIDSTNTFEGFNILVYHGYSFDHYVSEIKSVNESGGYDAPDLIMKSLLRKRHLGPSHTSTLPIYTPDQDRLVIEQKPDIFVTGHVHRTKINSYKNTILINASCWQDLTPFQERCGHIPQPAQLPLFNLKTREIKVLKFRKEEKQ